MASTTRCSCWCCSSCPAPRAASGSPRDSQPPRLTWSQCCRRATGAPSGWRRCWRTVAWASCCPDCRETCGGSSKQTPAPMPCTVGSGSPWSPSSRPSRPLCTPWSPACSGTSPGRPPCLDWLPIQTRPTTPTTATMGPRCSSRPPTRCPSGPSWTRSGSWRAASSPCCVPSSGSGPPCSWRPCTPCRPSATPWASPRACCCAGLCCSTTWRWSRRRPFSSGRRTSTTTTLPRGRRSSR
uniref:Putative rna polymerase ii largest subunit n=1 Tax=Ixodes ricinus TaxID=34613 RepID=A0A147BV56_IXORI